MRLNTANLTDLIGIDAKRLWATSYTVDEHEAFAVAYRTLGGRIPNSGVYMRFQRSGFQRAGQGVIPRSWLHPQNISAKLPLETYHPKLLLADTPDGYRLVVSTGNLTRDDLRKTRNLAVQLHLDTHTAKSIIRWIEYPPLIHRALCILVKRGKTRVIKSTPKSSLLQFIDKIERCPTCKASRFKHGNWVVAAPFWSPGVLQRMFECDPRGSIEAYFRNRTIWNQVGGWAIANSNKVNIARVQAFELQDKGDLPRWHHKVIGWRCCSGRRARVALYLGSANATMYGFFGSKGLAVNWEAGAIWLGNANLWKHVCIVARAGFSAKRIGTPEVDIETQVKSDDELGTTDTEEIERLFAAHLSRLIRINRSKREVSRIGPQNVLVRVLGHSWRLQKIRIEFEDSVSIKDGGVLRNNKRIRVPKATYVQVIAKYQRELKKGQDLPFGLPRYVMTRLDLTELDPEPKCQISDRKSAIASALAGLMTKSWGNIGDREK